MTILVKDKFFELRENNQKLRFVSSKAPSHRDSSLEHQKQKF